MLGGSSGAASTTTTGSAFKPIVGKKKLFANASVLAAKSEGKAIVKTGSGKR